MLLWCGALSLVFCHNRPGLSQTDSWTPSPITYSFTDQTRRSLWTLDSTPPVRIGGGTEGPTVLLSVYGAALLSGNRIAVADAGSYQIRLFAPNGTFIRSFGREGQGPGEFNSLWSLQRSADSLVGVDASGRAHVFASDGSLLRSYGRPYLREGRAPSRAGLLSDGSAIVYGIDRSPASEAPDAMLWWRVQRQTASDSSDLFRVPAHRAADERNWMPVGIVVAALDRVCAGYPSTFDITCFDSRGKPLFRIHWNVRRRAVTEDERQFLRSAHVAANISRVRREILEKEASAFVFAETAPAFGTLAIATNGELWVSEFHRAMGRPGPGSIIAPSAPVRWHVFGRNGNWVADVMLPARFVPYEMGTDYVIGVTFDQDDVEHVVLYRLRR